MNYFLSIKNLMKIKHEYGFYKLVLNFSYLG